MPSEVREDDPRVRRFCADLKTLRPKEVIRKHITTGVPVELPDEQYFRLRSKIADEFELHPSSVIIVGSCRTGFSIAPEKRYRAAKADSDLDVAIVSLERFDQYWDAVFAYSAENRAWEQSKRYKKFVRMLFHGWIEPRGLPSVPRFEQATRWSRFFDQLMQSREFGPRGITARLYRTWSRLEAYQEKAVRLCMASLGEQDHA
jgi:hypothetical protein